MRAKRYAKALRHLEWDAAALLLSVVIAYFCLRAGVFAQVLSLAQGLEIIGAFVAGVFFTSMFTISASSVVFAELAGSTHTVLIAFVGAIGAVCGDMLLFLFIRDTLVADLTTVLSHSKHKRFIAYFQGGLFRWLAPLLGALIIASPLPDELGLALMGLTRARAAFVIPVAFVMNFVGIWSVVSLAALLQG